MQAPMYVLTQDIQPGMLVEVDGTRVDVDAVLVDYPGVHLVQGRSGALVARYGAEARVVRVNAHPAARPAESVTYAEPRFPAVAEASGRTEVCDGHADAVDGCGDRECTCHIPAQSVWTPSTPDERRHTEVGRLVERTMRERPGLRYAVAYGNLSGLTLNAPEGWAAEFVRRLDAALADERKGHRS